MRGRATQLVAFAALTIFVALSWTAVVADPPLGRALAAVAIVLAAATLTTLLADRFELGPRSRGALLLAALALAALGALVVVGLPARLLAPESWSELREGIELGFAGIGDDVSFPYDGNNEWSRLILLLGAPLLVAIAAAVAFLPPRPSRISTLGALGVLVAGYATAVTIYDPAAPLLRGLLLALLLCAWLWLPAIRDRREWTVAVGLLAVALALAVPFSARVQAGDGFVDYRSWSWGDRGGARFDWEHSYGPIDWEREGKTMFVVETEEPNYWKARVLDRFNGRSWERSEVDRFPSELPSSVEDGVVPERRSEWAARAVVTIQELRSDLVVGPGTAREVLSGIDSYPSADATELRTNEAMSQGDAYQIRGYAPDPSVEELRAADPAYDAGLEHYLTVDLRGASGQPTKRVNTLGIGEGAAPEAAAALESSAYGRMFGLARELGAAGTPYDSVKAIETHLRSNYRYSENPPRRVNPLTSFLFEDRIGYCQQFSGAMALMVRMVGIPARVATGFSPGVANSEGTRYRVRDLDAHSWVEVYFNGIGWVPFDPTPAASPAELQGGGDVSPTAAASGLGGLLALGSRLDFAGGGSVTPDGAARQDGGAASGSGAGEAGLTTLVVLAALIAVVGLSIAVPAAVRRVRAASRSESALAEARVVELRLALAGLGWSVAPDTTLLELERRLRSRTEPEASGYLERLRRGRYERSGAPAPTAAQRRALRRRLSEGRGAVARLRALWLIPLGAPRV